MLCVSFLQAEPRITANVSAREIPVNGQLTLTLEIAGLQSVDGVSAISIPGVQVDNAGQTPLHSADQRDHVFYAHP